MIVRINGGRHINVYNYWNGRASMFQACWADNQGNELSGWTIPHRSCDEAMLDIIKGGSVTNKKVDPLQEALMRDMGEFYHGTKGLIG